MSKFVNFMVGAIVGAGASVAGLIYLANKKSDTCCSCDENSDCKCKCHDEVEELFDENGVPIVHEEVDEPVEEIVVDVPDEEMPNVRHRRFIIRRKKRNSHRKQN